MTAPSKETFVPLAAGPATKGRRTEFHVLVAERPETARSLRDLNPAPATADSAQNPRPVCEPRVSLQREANLITGIHIECSCGQIIDLKCAYQDAPAPAPV
jgi:hypothetical protein